MKVRFRRYLHASKESNFDLVKHFDNEVLLFCGCEEELVYEYDTKTQEIQLIGANGKFLGDEEITDGELEQIPSC